MTALFVFLMVCIAITKSNAHFFDKHHIQSFVRSHNTRTDVLWKATTENFKYVPDDQRVDHVKRLCGVKTKPVRSRLRQKTYRGEELRGIPETFDARTQWPDCPSIRKIRDQGPCGSCWAVVCAETASDRLCIQSHGRIKVDLSAQQIVSCCEYCGSKCGGGYADMAWEYVEQSGVVTGGEWNSNEGCYPYDVKPCNKYDDGIPCGDVTAPGCRTECRPGYNISYNEDKYYAEETYGLWNEDQRVIQAEIMANGPVESVIKLHKDFFTYKSGVYHNVVGDELGGHAIKILGWGVEQGAPYWLCANSWNSDWGDNGYFKILRGFNESGVEHEITTGRMKVDS